MRKETAAPVRLVAPGEKITFREFFARDVFTVKAVVVLAALLAIRTILGLPMLTIYYGDVKILTFGYVADALAAMLYGPIAGLAFGFAGDFLGFLATGGAGGGYFPGYAISEMITCFLFACFFFKRKPTVARTIIVWLLNLAIVLLGLNSYWFVIFRGLGAFQATILFRIGLNAAQAPLHIFILYQLLSRLLRIKNLKRYLYKTN